jgi:hypothetical protein
VYPKTTPNTIPEGIVDEKTIANLMFIFREQSILAEFRPKANATKHSCNIIPINKWSDFVTSLWRPSAKPMNGRYIEY